MSFNIKLIPVLLSSLLLMAGCEERKESDGAVQTSFQLISPKEGSNIYETGDEKIKVKYTGSVNLSNLLLELNGTDVTGKFALNNITDRADVLMSEVANSFVQGNNTLLAAEILLDENDLPELDGNGRPVIVFSQTFNFFLDNIPPRLTVNSVVPDIANGDGSPATGATITVEGDLLDVSDITELRFTSPGGTQVLTPTTSDPVGVNQFNPATKKYSVNLANYPNTSVSTTTPHFTYTITDSAEQTRTERFMATGTPISRQRALQINDTLAQNLNPLLNSMVSNAFTLVNSGANLFGVGVPLYDDPLDAFNSTNPSSAGFPREPVPGEQMKNPRNNCVFPSPDIDNVEECRPTGYTGGVRVFIFPANSAQCSGLLFKANAGVTDCVVFIRNLEINKPSVDFEFDKNADDVMLNLALWFRDINADVEIAGVRNENDGTFPFIPDNFTYLGGLKGKITFSRFSVETDVRLYPDSNFTLGIDRVTPFRMVLTDLLKVPQVTGTCNICSPLISPFAMIALAFGTDLNSNGDVDKAELIDMIGDTIENKAGPLVDSFIDTLPMNSTTVNNTVPGKQIISNSSAVRAYTVYNNNAHLVFNGRDRVDPAFYTPDYQVINGGLGSLFATQGDYYTNISPVIKGWGITSGGVKNIDLSFAISANSINQWLLANHQTGMFSELDLSLTGADFATADFDVDPADVLSLTFDTREAPAVKLTSKVTQSYQVCNGNNCITKGPSPGTLKLLVNNLDVNLDNVTDANVVLDANINLELEVELSVVAGAPRFTLKDNSVAVTVNTITQPVSPFITNSVLATAIGDGIESFMASPSFQALFGQQTTQFALSTLPGTGGSGVGCAGPSLDGSFCVSGQDVPYAALFSGGAIPRDFAMLFRWLTVEKGGTYLSLGIDVRNKPAGTWTAGELAENYMTWQLTDIP